MKKKLHISKETLKTLSGDRLEQVAGGTLQVDGSMDGCDIVLAAAPLPFLAVRVAGRLGR